MCKCIRCQLSAAFWMWERRFGIHLGQKPLLIEFGTEMFSILTRTFIHRARFQNSNRKNKQLKTLLRTHPAIEGSNLGFRLQQSPEEEEEKPSSPDRLSCKIQGKRCMLLCHKFLMSFTSIFFLLFWALQSFSEVVTLFCRASFLGVVVVVRMRILRRIKGIQAGCFGVFGCLEIFRVVEIVGSFERISWISQVRVCA